MSATRALPTEAPAQPSSTTRDSRSPARADQPLAQSSDQPAAPVPLWVDRVRCTGHGICASLLPTEIELDEWGYPVVAALADPEVGARDRRAAVRLCPARALLQR